jgi:hypothetical protein
VDLYILLLTAATEEYDGSTWTAGGNLNTARYNLAGCGTQTAGLAFGGDQHLLQEQQKNMMDLLGHLILDWFKYSKI